ncbi:MAG: MATE family efflux transporter [Pseudomonadota bacterium]
MTAPPLSHKRVVRIALPVVISNATVPILGAVDTGVVGQMGEAAPIGAVGVGAIVITSAFWLFGFLRMGTTGMTAQAIGRDDTAEVRNLLFRTLGVSAVLGLALVLLQWPIIAMGLALSGGSDDVNRLAKDYMEVRIWSAPFVVATYAIFGWLVGHERTDGVLVLQLWINGLNIALNFLFVLGFGWGVQGVAIASLIAEISGFVFGLWLVRKAIGAPWPAWAHVFSGQKLKEIASLNSDIMIRSFVLMASFMSFTMLSSRFDDETLAANQILIQFLHISAYGLDGFAFAAETLVGQATGARNRTRLRRAVYVTSLWGMVVATTVALVFLLGGWPFITLMTTSETIQLVAWAYLPWMIAAPFLGGPSWMLDGIFIGATRGKDMRNMMIVSAAIYAASVALLMPVYGNHGLWAALLIFFVARGVTLALRYPALERDLTDTESVSKGSEARS